MRYAVVGNNIVTNVAEAEKPFGENWVRSDTAEIGDLYDGVSFSPPSVDQSKIAAAWGVIRSDRNARLTASDWTQVADAPVDAALWAVYRQALRDLPQTQTDPFNVVWPEPPTT